MGQMCGGRIPLPPIFRCFTTVSILRGSFVITSLIAYKYRLIPVRGRMRRLTGVHCAACPGSNPWPACYAITVTRKLLGSGFEACFGTTTRGARVRYQNVSRIQILRDFEKKGRDV